MQENKKIETFANNKEFFNFIINVKLSFYVQRLYFFTFFVIIEDREPSLQLLLTY